MTQRYIIAALFAALSLNVTSPAGQPTHETTTSSLEFSNQGGLQFVQSKIEQINTLIQAIPATSDSVADLTLRQFFSKDLPKSTDLKGTETTTSAFITKSPVKDHQNETTNFSPVPGNENLQSNSDNVTEPKASNIYTSNPYVAAAFKTGCNWVMGFDDKNDPRNKARFLVLGLTAYALSPISFFNPVGRYMSILAAMKIVMALEFAAAAEKNEAFMQTILGPTNQKNEILQTLATGSKPRK